MRKNRNVLRCHSGNHEEQTTLSRIRLYRHSLGGRKEFARTIKILSVLIGILIGGVDSAFAITQDKIIRSVVLVEDTKFEFGSNSQLIAAGTSLPSKSISGDDENDVAVYVGGIWQTVDSSSVLTPEDALEKFSREHQQNPTLASAKPLFRTSVELRLGTAAQVAEWLIENHPSDPFSWKAHGQIQLAKQLPNDARDSLHRARKLGLDTSELYMLLASASDSIEEMIAHYKRAKEYDIKDELGISMNLAELYFMAGDKQRALQLAETTLRICDNAPARRRIEAMMAVVSVFEAAGMLEKADQIYKTAIQEAQAMGWLHSLPYEHYAFFLMLNGRVSEAESYLEKAIELTPKSISAWLRKAEFHFHNDEWDKEVDAYLKGVKYFEELQSGDGVGAPFLTYSAVIDDLPTTYGYLGEAQARNGQISRAIDSFKRAMTSEPHEAQWKIYYGELLAWQSNNRPSAAGEVKELISQLGAPGNLISQTLHASLVGGQGDYEKAHEIQIQANRQLSNSDRETNPVFCAFFDRRLEALRKGEKPTKFLCNVLLRPH